MVVGGAESLYVNPEHTLAVADGPDFPHAFKPLAAAHGEALRHLRMRDDVKWTSQSRHRFPGRGNARQGILPGR